MSLPDINAIVREYLTDPIANLNYTELDDLVDGRIFCPRLPENTTLPAVSFFTRGGTSTPYIPDIPTPSYQFDCWARDEIQLDGTTKHGSIIAREVYRALYDSLQGIQNVKVTVGTTDYWILSAIEEVQGQDLVDIEMPNYFRVLTFFQIMVKEV